MRRPNMPKIETVDFLERGHVGQINLSPNEQEQNAAKSFFWDVWKYNQELTQNMEQREERKFRRESDLGYVPFTQREGSLNKALFDFFKDSKRIRLIVRDGPVYLGVEAHIPGRTIYPTVRMQKDEIPTSFVEEAYKRRLGRDLFAEV